jgi:hypothetical protein
MRAVARRLYIYTPAVEQQKREASRKSRGIDAAAWDEEISAPLRTLEEKRGRATHMSANICEDVGYLVDLIGIEPMTSSMPLQNV